MSVPDLARQTWRCLKESVLSGKGGGIQRFLYQALAGFVARNKQRFSKSDLTARALWLMYHPELGVLPCDAWRIVSFPTYTQDEIMALHIRLQRDMKRVAERLRLVDSVLEPSGGDASVQIGRIAVHVHVYYEDIFVKIAKALSRLPSAFDLFISIAEGCVSESGVRRTASENLPQLRKLTVGRCPNRGRDLAPFVALFAEELRRYDIVGHFHTKKSPHEMERRAWLDHIIDRLLPSQDRLRTAFRLLSDKVGMIISSDYLRMEEDPSGWMGNLVKAEQVLAHAGYRLDIRRDFTPCVFPQGSMFWARTDSLERLWDLSLSFDDFEPEPIGTDGSLAHVLERLLCLWGVEHGRQILRVL